jgi:hypothetical protein
MRRASTIRPGQRIKTCSPACRDLMMMLWPLMGRIATASGSTPVAQIDAKSGSPST